MADDLDLTNPENFDKASGSQLRSKLEEVLRENRQLNQEITATKASQVITSNGFTLVKPEDLVGVSAADIESRAQELQSEREQQAQELIRTQLQSRGLEGDALEERMTALFDTDNAITDPAAEQWARTQAASSVSGSRTPAVNPNTLSPREKMKLALSASQKNR